MAALLLVLMLAVDLPADASREVARGECKAVDRDEIIVCGSRKRDECYRLPDRSNAPFDPAGDMKSVMNERVGWAAEGDTGTQSCSVAGPGGWTGCMVKGWKQERDQPSGARTSRRGSGRRSGAGNSSGARGVESKTLKESAEQTARLA